MGCCLSAKELNYDRIRSAIVLQTKCETFLYHGTTERGRFQRLGNAKLVLAEDGIFSQFIGISCCIDRGFVHIPLFAITNIHDQAWFNGLYRINCPHLVITYIVPGKGEHEADWQMTSSCCKQWRKVIEGVLTQKRMMQWN
ncbi:unnamed protein product [Rotaria magnacalcarata]|uniref:Uncharacterized protein n=1 Tax=Rotaria magnacalcarata TaxID=392030 RepID=A0A819TJ68_9BILA|nr:unnamed protein product [Rotaria magnacalcarata]CAF2218938.1 unnamed protein product [Rotaria magnacalcarata]CAF3848110.1 unnamed protein product [Rotaria magnacalcarata]CAF4074059.1 unnamed protein product [Rotaria magnacalcarata]